MTNDYLEKKFDNCKRAFLIWFGVVITLLAVAVAEIPNTRSMYYLPGWYGVWFIAQVGTVLTAIELLFRPEFRRLPFSERLNTIFSYIFAGWIALVAFEIKSIMYSSANTMQLNFLGNLYLSAVAQRALAMGILGAAIGLTYGILKRKYVNSPEAMFP